MIANAHAHLEETMIDEMAEIEKTDTAKEIEGMIEIETEIDHEETTEEVVVAVVSNGSKNDRIRTMIEREERSD